MKEKCKNLEPRNLPADAKILEQGTEIAAAFWVLRTVKKILKLLEDNVNRSVNWGIVQGRDNDL